MAHQSIKNGFGEFLESILKTKTVLQVILRYLRNLYLTLSIIFFALLFWVYQAYLSGPGVFEINDFHPFRSEIAKVEYLKYYDEKAKEWPLKSEERIVSTSFGQTFIRISGPENAPPMVLLPGGGTASLMWKNNIKDLSENYRTYALDDIYDWGRSVYTKKMCCPESITKWLDELFTALELGDSIILVGCSYGGWKAGQYLLAHPNRLSKLVLLSPAYTVYHGNKEFEKRVFRGFIPLRFFMKKELYWSCENLVQTEKGREIAEEHLDYLRLAIRSFKTKIPPAMTVWTDDELKNIKVPILYIAGENEKMMSVKAAVKRLNHLTPAIKTEIIPNAGHAVFFTHPELVSEKILDFLK